MRNKHLLLALLAVLLPPALAGAGTLDNLTATADCNGWSSQVTIAFTARSVQVLLVVDMSLTDAAGLQLDHFHSEQWVQIPTTPTYDYAFAGNWPAPLEQPAQMLLVAQVYNARGDAISMTSDDRQVSLTCPDSGGPPSAVCHHAARWWLRHRSQWPAASLVLGGVTYDRVAIERLLRAGDRERIAVRLAHQLAIAKLNLANGAVDDIAGLVAAADAWLVAHPVSAGPAQDPSGSARREGLRLTKDLCQWNHAYCEDGARLAGDETRDGEATAGLSFDTDAYGVEFTGDLAGAAASDKAVEETTSLGTLKAMYR